jgi:hypothetical protein
MQIGERLAYPLGVAPIGCRTKLVPWRPAENGDRSRSFGQFGGEIGRPVTRPDSGRDRNPPAFQIVEKSEFEGDVVERPPGDAPGSHGEAPFRRPRDEDIVHPAIQQLAAQRGPEVVAPLEFAGERARLDDRVDGRERHRPRSYARAPPKKKPGSWGAGFPGEGRSLDT